jgi:predicted Zn-dependent protease
MPATPRSARGRRWSPQVAIDRRQHHRLGANFGGLTDIGSQLGASVLLSSYSRDNEREADALGQEYMVRAGYPASGMVGLQQLLVDQEEGVAGHAADHVLDPPDEQRAARHGRETAGRSKYAASNSRDPGRERFMDNTAALRRIKPTIEACQKGEVAMAGKDYAKAAERFRTALKATPRDYAANLLMAKCLAAQDKDGAGAGIRPDGDADLSAGSAGHKLVGVLALARSDPAAPTSISTATTACCRATPASPSSRAFRSKAWAASRRRPSQYAPT